VAQSVHGEISLQQHAARQREIVMRDRFSGSMVTLAIVAAALVAAVWMPITETSAQTPGVSGTALKTPWGEPDLQGIWTDTFDTVPAPSQICQPGILHRSATGRAG